MDPTKASSLHHFIYREINSDLTSSDLVQLKAELRPYLDRDTINKCQDGYDICRGLERAGHISIGNYEVLKTILEAAGFINLRHCIETKSAEIEPAQGHNISDNDHRRRDILHHAIYREIVTDLTSSDFEELKAAVRPYLDRAIIDRCQNGYTICDELEKSGVISKGNYEMLKTILNSAGLINLRERIETRAAEIEPDVPTMKTRKVNENNVIHNEILQLVNQEIIPNEFRGFQRAANVYLSNATVARCKSGFHICCELEKAGKIKVGDYENLKKILVMADLISLKKRIEEEESKIIKGSDEVPKTSHCSGDGAQGNVHDTHSPEQASSANKDSIDDGSDEAPKTSHYSALAPKSDVLVHMNERDKNIWWKIMSSVQNSDICREWRTLARQLCVSDSDIDEIAHSNPQLKEQCYQMLRRWRQISGSGGTPSGLIIALKELHFEQVAEQVENCIR